MLDVAFSEHAIRIGARFAVSFQSTLRIPDDGRTYLLPPGLGVFPIFKVDDYAERVPPLLRAQGGAFIAMYKREALWLGFDAAPWKPSVVRVAVGRINAVSGEEHRAGLRADPQTYIVCPDQPWLDGIKTGPGSVRQFVAMPLGQGYTVEAALRGTEEFGGIQITVFEPKPGRFPEQPPIEAATGPQRFGGIKPARAATQTMGLGAGGVMKQKIYPDAYGIETWDLENYGRVAVHIVNSEQFFDITGIEAPPPPIDARTYTAHGLPWFDLYDEAREDLPRSERLVGVKTIAERDAEGGEATAGNASVDIAESRIEKLRPEALGVPTVLVEASRSSGHASGNERSQTSVARSTLRKGGSDHGSQSVL